MEKKGINKLSPLIAFLIIFFLTFITYANSLKGEFVFDDIYTIVKNPVVKDWKNIRAIFESAPSRFITNYSFALNYQISGLRVEGYHFINIFIHILTSFVVYLIVRLISESVRVPEGKKHYRDSLSFFAALLFALHPIQTQAVTYISQRYTSIAALFYLSTVYFYLKAFSSPHFGTFYLISIFTGILALFSKENTFTLPFSLMLADLCFISKSCQTLFKRVRYLVPFILITAFVFNWWFHPIREGTLSLDLPSAAQDVQVSRWHYLLTQGSVFLTYLRLLILPISQNADYDYPLSTTFWEASTLISFLVILHSVILAILIFRRNRLIPFGILFFLVALSAESSIIPIADVIAEHRLYLPFFGFAFCFAEIIYSLKDFFLRRKMNVQYPNAVVTFILITLMFLTYQRNKTWQSEETFWRDAVYKSPQKARAHYNLAVIYDKKGRLSDAVEVYQKVIQLNPSFLRAYNNLGTIYESQKNYAEAEKMYLTALEIDENNVVPRINLARLYYLQDKLDESIREYNRVLSLAPDNYNAYNGLGISYTKTGRNDLAKIAFSKAEQLKPNNESADNLEKTFLNQ